MVDTRARLGKDIVINARTDVAAISGIEAAIARCLVYMAAGADMVFIDGIKTRADIARAAWTVKSHEGLLSVNLMDGVTGVKTELVPIPELARLGVARVSIPVASIMVAHKALLDFFTALRASPTGTLPERTDLISTFADYTAFVGLGEYRELEKTYLPNTVIDEKYGKK